MIVSVTGTFQDGTEISFHVDPAQLSTTLQKALQKGRETGGITESLLKEMQEKKLFWQSMIDEQLEFNVRK